MDKQTFLSTPDVRSFTDWLAACHPHLSIKLDIKSSRYVPGGVRANLVGLDTLLSHYRWRTHDSEQGDWEETRETLRTLGANLRRAMENEDEDGVLEACRQILIWGGDRRSQVGALPYLSGLHEQGRLVAYLETAREAFSLEQAVIRADRAQAGKMNSMLTKVHALASTDGLPIYDSRVAAAIASLVELWRRQAGKQGDALPQELVFPATSSDRSVLSLFDDAQDPGVMSYAPGAVAETARRWSSAKVRLGWLMSAVLDKAAGLFGTQERQSRMHAFEASLFMIGYDVVCLEDNALRINIDPKQRALLQAAARRRLRLEHADLPHKKISTLSGTEQNLAYAGTVETGISGVWGETTFAFESDFLEELLAEFATQDDVGLGASKTGTVKADTLGFWIEAHYPGRSRAYASALAAIFVNEGLAGRIEGKAGIRLRFQ